MDRGNRKNIILCATLVLIVGIATAYRGKEISKGSQPLENVSTEENTFDFKTECEENAKNNPATVGSILVTKGDYDFTGMKYYFNGEIIGKNTIENDVGDSSVWLVENKNGYVMPIQYNQFNAEVGDKVEVWGTLSGDGYSSPKGIENVVEETGSMNAIIVSINGEEQQ